VNIFRTDFPPPAAALQSLFAGAVFHWPANAASQQLVKDAWMLIDGELGDGGGGSAREAQFRLSDGEFFDRVGRLRRAIYTAPHFHAAVGRVVRACGFATNHMAFDPIRLRVISHRGHENPKAAPIYYAHRDTWYAHSQAELTWWVPLHDVMVEETFVFYPDWFDRTVPNNSEEFDYVAWTQHGPGLRIGWQQADAGRMYAYPGQVGAFDPGRTIGFAASKGDLIVFAGAHFHQTRKNGTGRTRFSLDFRTVDLDDHDRGGGAPNVDNRSTGSALVDYVRV
jgi:hypothetical protein